MAATLTTLLSSPAGLPFLRSGSIPWKGSLRDRAEDLRGELAGVDPEAFARAVDREMRWRFDALLTGVERYRNHPYRRDLADPPAVWREGPARLLDYGADDAADGNGVPVLFVPSLINRHYILDLSGECSLMRWLVRRGIRPLLLDWGRPGPAERRFTMTDFVAGRLERALNAVLDLFPARPAVVGYCMGGLLATALAQRRPRDIAALALLATPWDFHGDNPAAAKRTAAALAPYEPVLDAWGELPVDAIQALFAMQDPLQVARKFTRFARMPPEGAAARGFVALEDWLNDGVALPASVARDCLTGWYGRNDTAEGRWTIAGESVDPRRLRPPALVMIPEKDRIVPPCSARALALAIPGAAIHNPHLGHVGMIVSAGAQTLVWEPLAEWLCNRR
ncbi:alpha/beta fold hydrolase [Skermanella sp. TT6]|nr:alpha/beta fold hydrolase [Skermanella sp. TT6]